MSAYTKSALLAAALAMCAASAFAECGKLDDPNSPRCLAAPPRDVLAPPKSDVIEKGRGQTVCAFFDTKTERCLTMRPNTKQYDSAIRTGVETAMMGMQYMADGREEAHRMGIAGTEGTGPGSNAATNFNSCVKDGLDRIAQAQKTKANQEQVSLVLKGCAK